jgi:solute carrier family 25 aspartate/glutamate transporter 12/13
MLSRQVSRVPRVLRATQHQASHARNSQTRRFTTERGATPAVPPTAAFGRKAWLLGAGALIATGAAVVAFTKTVQAEDIVGDKQQRATFDRYASLEKGGQKFMTADDFLKAITAVENTDAHPRGALDEDKFRVLFRMADVDKNNLITFQEYVNFQSIINKPDAEYMLAFTIFDRDANGKISKSDFQAVVETSFLDSAIPFDFNCDLVRLYFGKGSNELTYSQFTQLLKDLQQERVRQEFRYYDKEGSGYIPAEKFSQILSGIKLRRVPAHIKENLAAVASLNKGSPYEGQVSYAQFVACNDMLLHIPSYARVIRAASNNNSKRAVTKEEFSREAHKSTSVEITPMEVDIIFALFDADKDGKLSLADFDVIANPDVAKKARIAHPVVHKTFAQAVLESVENFALGAVAGGIGATAVYPIDLVKTRMQNQRAVESSKRIYNNSWDCFNKVLKNEGFRGLYKGLGPQLVGVAPEKAIKLTVNDLLRGLFEDRSKGEIYFPLEVLAGGSAGASQVLFTNPLEIVKIRLQVQGETIGRSGTGISAITIVRELGFFGLYRGAGACLLRDIPFSAIYFPTYAKMKTMLTDENGKLGPTQLLFAGAVAGIPAASLVTPADVIKTRLQVKARLGDDTYTGIRDCAKKVYTAEGITAFFKGCLARVFRSSPQFGVTLLSYEMLQRFFAPTLTPRPPTNAPVTKKDFESFSSTVQKVEEMEKKFGHIASDK